MAALRALVIFSLAALVSVKAMPTVDDEMCSECRRVMGDVKQNLNALTGEASELLKRFVKVACEQYVRLPALAKVCVNFEESALHALLNWIQERGIVNPDVDLKQCAEMAALRALVIFSLVALVSVKAAPTSDDEMCNDCIKIMGDIKQNLNALTGEASVLLKGFIKNACQHYVALPVFKNACVNIEQNFLFALTTWIQERGVVNPDLDCQYLQLCPRAIWST
ncbi:hypothetical protein GCK32_016047 [Trichostrongylus colubriformis]|uniref:Saposin B-type domain-containing protein n=1 Tax=Trichostrongylus colubriformis TaxID=6319 RepID=A0AAN8ETI3_TRICO